MTPQYRFKAAHLTKDDFSVVLDHARLTPNQFELDNFCPEREADRPPEPKESARYVLFVVDQMRSEGQFNTNAMLRSMIPRMAAAGYQLKILPNAVPEWTSDVDRLLRDVGRLFGPSNPLPETITDPLESTLRALMESNQVEKAIAVAQEAEAAEQLTFEGPALQFERVISEMATLPMPKAIIYFADSAYFSRERILEAAIRSGIAIYAVKANGIPEVLRDIPLVNDAGAATTTALLSLSEHSGGKLSLGHFTKSASDTILKRVETGLSCVYVLSIDVAGLDRDRTLHPKVRLRPELKGQVTAETIPDFTIPNEKRQQEDEASTALRSSKWPGLRPARVSLVPVGFVGSRVNALIQFSLDSESGASSIPTAWDVGINYFGASRVSGYGNLRVTIPTPRVVFEKLVRLPIGPYSIVGIAKEVDGHELARGTEVGAFNSPKKNAVEFLHPLHIMQWEPGTFVSEEDNVRKEGWSSLRYAMAHFDRPISLVISLCRDKNVQELLTIEKSLVLPDKELRFSETAWPQEHGTRCLVVKDDLLPASGLPWSNQPYEVTCIVRVNDASGKAVAKTSTAFWIIGPAHEGLRSSNPQ